MKQQCFLLALFLINFFNSIVCIEQKRQTKVLHMSYHMGCIKDFADVAKELNLDLCSWHIFSKPIDYLDGISTGFDIYNITHDKADRIWLKHKAFFEQFDVIITSDTPVLARPFLQNSCKKPLIIYMCNRFDYDHGGKEEFPDKELYDLFRQATKNENVKVIASTPYEHTYASLKGVITGNSIIKPLGSLETDLRFTDTTKNIPAEVDKPNTFFIYPQINNEQYKFVYTECKQLGLKGHTGKYNGPNDLTEFKGIIYVPYQAANWVLFEGMNRGFVFFVPSKKFLRELISQDKVRVCCYFNPELYLNDFIDEMEWYLDAHKDLFVFFDSWQDLKLKTETIDYQAVRKSMQLFGAFERHATLERWKKVFSQFHTAGLA